MIGKPGDWIVVESAQVGLEPRRGQILEVIEGEVGVRYRVRWMDGHESILTPKVGSARILPAKEPASA